MPDGEHLARVKAEAKAERLNAAWNECSADKHRLLKEVRALDAEVERLQARVRELEAALAAVHLCDCNPVARAALAAVSAEKEGDT